MRALQSMMMVVVVVVVSVMAGMTGGCTGVAWQPSEDGTTLLREGEREPGMAFHDPSAPSADARLPRALRGHDSGVSASIRARVLVWHSHDPGQLPAVLASLGHEVTVSRTLPDDLSVYDVIWHVAGTEALSAGERARLAGFLAADGGLHLTGERPCCQALTDSLTALVNDVVAVGGVTIGRQGDVFAIDGSYMFPYAVNPDAGSQVARSPNPARNLQLIAAGGIAGLAGRDNVLVEGRAGSNADAPIVPVGALWSSRDLVGHAGRLTIVMDVNWFGYPDAADNRAMIENIQTFLQGGAPLPCPVAHAGADRSHTCMRPGERVPIHLDGTGSTSPGGGTLTYRWYDRESLIAVGPTPVVELPLGEHEITLVVSDGTCDSQPDTVRISLAADEEPPSITLLGADPAIVECGTVYEDPGATAEDACSGDLSAGIVSTSEVDTTRTGTYTVHYEVMDAAGLSAHGSRTVIVADTTPPVLEPVPMLELWPPDGSYHTFALSDCVAIVADACDGARDVNEMGRILAIYSDEREDDRTGDGRTSQDIVILDERRFQVRAERHARGDGRVYGVVIEVADASGNTTELTCRIGVPHDASGKPPVDSGAGAGYTVTVW